MFFAQAATDRHVNAKAAVPSVRDGAPRWLGNSCVALVDQALVSGANFASVVIVGRFCGAEQLGAYALAYTALMLAMSVEGAIITSPYTFYFHGAENGRRKLLAGSTVAHQCLLSGPLAVVILGIAGLLTFHSTTAAAAPAMAVMAITAPLMLFKELARRIALAEFQVGRALAVDSTVTGFQLGGMLFFAWHGWLSAAWAHAVGGASCALVTCVWLLATRGNRSLRSAYIARQASLHWAYGRWIVVDQLLAVSAGFMAQWQLNFMLSATEAGIFVACMNIVQIANPFLFGLGNIIEPRMCVAVARGGLPAVSSLVWRASAWLAALLTMLCVAFVIGGEWLVKLLFEGLDLGGTSLVIALLSVSVFSMGMSVVVYHGLRAAEYSQLNVLASSAAFIVTFVVGMISVPQWRLCGAAGATLLGQAAALAVRWAGFRLVIEQHVNTCSAATDGAVEEAIV